MLARHVMLAWYMFSFEIFYGIWTSIDKKKLYFCDFPGEGGGGGGPDPLSPPPLDPLMIRLLPSANWTVSILSHTEWWYKKHHLKTNIEMKQTANDKSPGNCWHIARRTHDHRAIALGLPQDDHPMSIRFYGPCKGIVWRPCGLLTTIARVYDHFWAKMTI